MVGPNRRMGRDDELMSERLDGQRRLAGSSRCSDSAGTGGRGTRWHDVAAMNAPTRAETIQTNRRLADCLHRMKILPLRGAAFAAVLLGGTVASAAIIGSTGYEGPPDFSTGYYYTYAYDFAGYGSGGPNNDLGGNAVNTTATVSSGFGVGSSGGFQLFGDATAVPAPNTPYPGPGDPPVQYSYWGMGGGNGLAVINAPTSPNIADYRIQMDLRAVGLSGQQGTIEFTVEFQVPDDLLGGDPDTNGDVILSLEFLASNGRAFLVNNNFATYSTALDLNSRVAGGSLALFAQYYSAVTNINVNVAANNGAGEFGLDSGNSVFVDNEFIEQVPEPCAGALLGVSLAGWAARRRRSSVRP
jgi:hypothetical protein